MKKFIAFVLAFAPATVLAQQQLNNINDVATKFTNIGNLVTALVVAFIVVWIVISVARFLLANSDDAKKKGKNGIIWGIVGLAIISSIWGLVFLLTNSFKTNNQIPQNQIPTLPRTPIVP